MQAVWGLRGCECPTNTTTHALPDAAPSVVWATRRPTVSVDTRLFLSAAGSQGCQPETIPCAVCFCPVPGCGRLES